MKTQRQIRDNRTIFLYELRWELLEIMHFIFFIYINNYINMLQYLISLRLRICRLKTGVSTDHAEL